MAGASMQRQQDLHLPDLDALGSEFTAQLALDVVADAPESGTEAFQHHIGGRVLIAPEVDDQIDLVALSAV